MSAHPFMQLYVSDFLGDTLHLSTEEVGAYLLILMAMWNGGGRLPDDEAKLARVARLPVRRWRVVAENIMGFFERKDGFVTQARLSDELQKCERKSQVRANAGSLGGAAKSLNEKNARLANASDLPKHLPEPESEKRDSSLRSLSDAPTPEKPSKPRRTEAKATRLPSDWQPTAEMISYAEGLGFTQPEIQIETEKIRNWAANAGSNGAKKDWLAFWRNWFLKRLEERPRHGNASSGNKSFRSSSASPDAEPFSRNVRVAALAEFRQERLARERQAPEPEIPDFFGGNEQDKPRGRLSESRAVSGFDSFRDRTGPVLDAEVGWSYSVRS